MPSTFYVANSGSDAANGLSSGTPWATVAKVNGSTFAAGDSILFNRGGAWRGATLAFPSSGSDGAPITIGAYGAGANPIISGGALVTAWTQQTAPGASFGTASIGGTADNANAGYLITQKETLAAGATVTAVSWYLSGDGPAGGGTQNLEAVIYSDSAGAPDALLATSGQLAYASGTAAGWVDFTFPGVTLSAGDYHLGIVIGTATQIARTRIATVANASRYRAVTYPTAPTPYSGGSLDSKRYSVTAGSASVASATYAAALTSAPILVTANNVRLVKGVSATALTSGQWFWTGNVLYVNLGGTDPGTATIEAVVRQPALANGKTDLTWRNLTFSHGFNASLTIYGGSHRNVVQDCTVQFACYDTYGGALSIAASTNCTVLRTLVDQNENDGIWAGQGCAGLEIGYCTITNVYSLLSDGIQIDNNGSADNSGWWVHDNDVDMTGTDAGKGCFISQGPANGSTASILERNTFVSGSYGMALTASNITARYNLCRDQVTAFGGGVHVDGGLGAIDNVTIVYNIVSGSNRDGIVLQDGSNTRTNWTIAHNTIVNCGRAMLYLGSPISGIIENNIVYWATQPSLRALYIASVVSGQTLTVDYNEYGPAFNSMFLSGNAYSTLAAWTAGTGRDAHSLQADPRFRNLAAGDYRLPRTSPLRNAGTPVAGIGQRAVGGRPDMGRWEFDDRASRRARLLT